MHQPRFAFPRWPGPVELVELQHEHFEEPQQGQTQVAPVGLEVAAAGLEVALEVVALEVAPVVVLVLGAVFGFSTVIVPRQVVYYLESEAQQDLDGALPDSLAGWEVFSSP